MGCGSSYDIQQTYMVTIPQGNKQAESDIYRSSKSPQSLSFQPHQEVSTLQDMILKSVKESPTRNCFGRVVDGKYVYQTYSEVLKEAEEVGNGLLTLGLVKEVQEYKNYKLKMVGIFSKNRPEWMMVDIANMLYGFTMVPFYETLGLDAIPFILQQTNLETMFITADAIKSLVKITDKHKLKNLICLDELTEEQKDSLMKLQYNLFDYQLIRQKGQQNNFPYAQVNPQDVYTFSYTSGTTGNPKGAMLSHSNFVSTIAGALSQDLNLTPNDVSLSYLPLPHVMERLLVLTLLCSQATIGFYRGDPLKLKDDILLLQPTLLMSVPRIYNKFYDGIKGKIDQLGGLKKSIADMALSSKLEALHTKAQYRGGMYDSVFAAVREGFGGRLRLMITGSAPISQQVIDYLKVTVGCPIYEGYGSTESTGGSFITQAWDPFSGHVGGPTCANEFKLVDVPEMNYTSADIVEGKATPRGEICVRGPTVFLGYYKDPEKTAEAIDQDGWLHMGDVGMITPEGRLKIIDRKKNIFKLQQGEYIAPEKLESIYNRAPGVAESFVYGDPLQNYCVGIIVPHKEYIEQKGKELNQIGSFEELCKNKMIIEAIQRNINDFGRANKLNSLEIVKSIYLEPQSFGLHDCFTTTFKLQRFKAKEVFKNQINALYQS